MVRESRKGLSLFSVEPTCDVRLAEHRSRCSLSQRETDGVREKSPIIQAVSAIFSPLETRLLSLTLNPSPAGRGKPPVNALAFLSPK